MGVLSLLLVAVTFTTTTYAWFKINSNANVDGFEFQVSGGEGFQVSVDGHNYYRDLSLRQIQKAILVKYKGFTINENEELIQDGEAVNDSQIESLIREIQLLPRTSTNGFDIYDNYNARALPTDGSYVEFDVYFKTNSTETMDELKYDIFLSGKEILLNDGSTVAPTSITSEVTNVSLKAKMITGDRSLNPKDTIEVYSANAMRMSIQDNTSATPQATIYELPNERDLGSYATDYNGGDSNLDRLYNADKNAMFTYYNNLRPSAKLNKMRYEEKPETIRSLDGDIPRVTRIQSGEEAKVVTFRLWLEGWDADCFDGLDKSISVKLSFDSKTVEEG